MNGDGFGNLIIVKRYTVADEQHKSASLNLSLWLVNISH